MKKSVLLIILSSILFACEKDITHTGDKDYEFTETASDILSLSGQSHLVLECLNSSISIRDCDTAANIYIEIEKIVRSYESVSHARSHMSDIIIRTGLTTHKAEIEVDHPTDNELEYNINFNLILPSPFDYEIGLGNGSITMISATKNVTMGLGNGEIIADLDGLDTCDINMGVGNGTINLTIPSAIGATLNATVGNGTVTSSGLSLHNTHTAVNSLIGTLEDGSGSIILSVGNGVIVIQGE